MDKVHQGTNPRLRPPIIIIFALVSGFLYSIYRISDSLYVMYRLFLSGEYGIFTFGINLVITSLLSIACFFGIWLLKKKAFYLYLSLILIHSAILFIGFGIHSTIRLAVVHYFVLMMVGWQYEKLH